MANKTTDESTPEELDSDAIEKTSDDQQSQPDGPEEAKGQSERDRKARSEGTIQAENRSNARG